MSCSDPIRHKCGEGRREGREKEILKNRSVGAAV